MSGQTNIFLVKEGLAPEDRFTAHLQFLCAAVPEVGQRWANHLLESAGREPSRIVRTIDHPHFGGADAPDFLIECEDAAIIVEHKIDAELGADQLERYLRLDDWRDKPTSVAFVARERQAIPVAAAPNYLKPTQGDEPHDHYYWRELYDIIEDLDHPVAKQFVAYMTSLQMAPVRSEYWRGMFANGKLSEMRQLWSHARASLRDEGVAARLTAGKAAALLALKPYPWARFVRFEAVSRLRVAPDGVDAPYLVASIAVDADAPLRPYLQAPGEQLLESSFGPIASIPSDRVRGPDKDMVVVRQFVASLESALSADKQEVEQNLEAFARAALSAAKDLRAQFPTTEEAVRELSEARGEARDALFPEEPTVPNEQDEALRRALDNIHHDAGETSAPGRQEAMRERLFSILQREQDDARVEQIARDKVRSRARRGR